MKNQFLKMKGLLVFSITLMSGNANAAFTTLLTLNAEAEPGKTSYLGVNTDSDNQITGLYYKGHDGKIETFTLNQLAQMQVLFSKKGYELVTLRVPRATGGSAFIALNYNKNVFSDDAMETRYFSIKYNPALKTYEIYDEKQRRFTSAYVTTHRNRWSVPVGIDEIQTQ